jgi:hypothetical protein
VTVSKVVLSFHVTAVAVDKLLSEMHLDVGVTVDEVHSCDIPCTTEAVLYITNHVMFC